MFHIMYHNVTPEAFNHYPIYSGKHFITGLFYNLSVGLQVMYSLKKDSSANVIVLNRVLLQ